MQKSFNRKAKAKNQRKMVIKLKNKKIAVWIIKEIKPVYVLLFFSLCTIIALAIIATLRPVIISNAITLYLEGFHDNLISYDDAVSGIQLMGLLFFIAIVSELILSVARSYLLSISGQKVIYSLRQKLFAHIQKLPLKFFDKTPVGALVTRVTNDTEALSEMFNSVLIGFLQSIFYIIFILIMMFKESVLLALISIALVPLIVLSTVLCRKKTRSVFSAMRLKTSQINAFLHENISGIRIIKVFELMKYKVKAFDTLNQEFYHANMGKIILFGIFNPIIDVVKYLTLTILLWSGGLQYLGGALEIGVIYLFITYISELFNPILNLADQANVIQSSVIAVEKTHAILEEDTELSPLQYEELGNVKGEIRFNDVWFAYDDENWVLKGVSFSIKAGEHIAIVGSTGSGKSTIINLLSGFYEIQKGSITIDGIDIKNLRKEDYRLHIGLVLQDVYLTNGSLEENIKLNNHDISHQKIAEIIESLKLGKFVDSLEGGYAHHINQGGTSLSSGERQLISFARSLLYNPKILIMDEATSSLDTRTEVLLQNALENLMKNRTTITIAHRLSTIRKSDRIFALNRGVIETIASYDELVENKERYYQIHE